VTQLSLPIDDELQLLDLSLDLFCIAGFDGYFKRVNRALVNTLGYSQEELLSTPFLDITHPDDRERARQALAQLAAGEDVVGFETRVICADGSVRWLEWNTSTRPDEGFVFGVARDVTDRRLDNAQLDALRRVATLVAEGVEPQELFAVVAEEVARVVDVSLVGITRYEPDGTATECASFATEGSLFPVGKRWSLDGTNVVSMIRESSEAARINDHSGLQGEIADALRLSGARSTVGVPIVVAQRLWGAMVVSSREPEPLPESIEARLAGFTELLAVAIESAESRDALSRLAEEQAALRRVATLVAQGAPPHELFAAAAKEVEHVFGLCSTTSDVATVVRFDPGPESVLVGMSKSIEGLPLESRWQPKDLYVSTRVSQTGCSARVDAPDLDAVDDPDADALRSQRLFSQVGSPIVVDGRLWGAMTLNAYERLPPDTEERLEKFTELVATAIANSDSRGAVARLANEHAALRRVATLVARGIGPEQIFAGVAAEVEALLGGLSAIVRFERDSSMTVMGATGGPHAVGARIVLDPDFIIAAVLTTRQAARFDTDDPAAPDMPDVVRDAGIRSAVASPIVVDGEPWGAILLASLHRSLPADMEQRLVDFTELVGTAVANTHAREQVTALADEQAALRRVATLVAQGVRPGEMFSALTEAVAQVIAVPVVSVVRYEEDGTATELSSFSSEGAPFAVGSRWSLEGTNVLRLIRESSAAARIDDYSGLEGEIAELVRRSDLRSTVGIPIVVAGRLWGAMVVSGTQRLPTQTELRLAKFTELLATAIENAESREALELLADQQAALRRVATLVAGGAPPQELFAAVAEEVGRLLHVGGATMWRFEPEGTVTTLAAWSTGEVAFPAGTRWSTEGRNVPGIVYRTGRPARLDDFSDASGPIGRRGRETGYRSAVGSPITVQGRLWGVVTAASSVAEPLPVDTETRLASFTELVATAIANAESHDAVARLAAEQAALRRVAMLVAQGVPPAEIFSSVSNEVDQLFRLDEAASDVAGVIRFGPGPEFVVVGTSRAVDDVPLGSRWEPRDLSASTRVLRTGRSARVDEGDLAAVGGSYAEFLRSQGFLSQVASPIVVEGSLWGAVTIDAADTLPPDTERRLERFGELVATAIANVEARGAAARLTEEQTALRRVAMLVAQGVPPAELFSAVSNEIERLFRLEGDPTAVGAVIRIDPGPEFVLAGASRSVDAVPVGLRWGPKDLYASTRVLRTGRSARIDEADLDALGGPDADFMRRQGYLSQVASPIVVEGRLWGVITMNASDVLAADTERRLESFGELVATAIANVEAREAVARLVDEQAALRRMATLVAVGAAPNVVFDAVISEANELLAANGVALSRYEPDDEILVVANCGPGASEVPPGTRIKHEGENVTSLVRRTGETARLEQYEHTETAMAQILRSLGVHAAVGAPIVVGGNLWGVMMARWGEDVSPPADTEERLARFAQVVDTAIANAAAREEIERLAEEQAALRRVATLVAEGITPSDIFVTVSREVERVFGLDDQSCDRATVIRFDPGPECVLVGAAKEDPEEPMGLRWEPKPLYVSTKVLATERSARVDEQEVDAVGGPDGDALRRRGHLCQVGSPIVVEGRLWGAVTLNTREPLPADTDQRLEKFTELVGTAIANAESQSELAASRLRIVSASDEARRQIERDLHDGVQQRLVSLALGVRAAEASVPADRNDLRLDLAALADDLNQAVDEVQELSRGIHPAVLSKRGLSSALRALARRSAIPVELELATNERLPEPIEVALYYVASESLTNATKHAEATHVRLSLNQADGKVRLTIRDDGIGGADPDRGSGLVGLRDRVEALGGRIEIESPPGAGTSVVVALPLADQPLQELLS
jgi:PAS domain S-box-containing protein